MSLKAFHAAFIVLAIALAGWVAVWAWGERAGGTGYLAAALAAGVVGVALAVYLAQFLRKMKDVSYL